ncbi:MAG TPA: undecaprenyldiphospho-muramoylpentapeptide beta-N-acetylglucosaminyltransferase [Adhaeribacter sp.]|nr:undecaprenyldiphospho-muramoylpentapeptide beta-N-acetylglucosaminyltransferase [Adhaeribacter sp.]
MPDLNNKKYRLIISGGGTGGHIFPAIAIANRFKKLFPESEILFVGANGRMEMTKVPEAGYKIVGLNIAGLQRQLTLKNLSFPFKVISSVRAAGRIIADFKPDAVVGVGGYASAPVLFSATSRNIPALIQEQNSHAGITNKLLAKRVSTICVAYDGMEKAFPKEKIVLTGNPVRSDIIGCNVRRPEALEFFGLDPKRKTILVIGGSLGARTLNEATSRSLAQIAEAGYQLLWQTGKSYYAAAFTQTAGMAEKGIKAFEFIRQMDLAYAAADLVISRAGALSISELCLASKPSILVPSPNVAEDHQTKNAMALVQKSAAVLVRDAEAVQKLYTEAFGLLADEDHLTELSRNIEKMARPEAATEIVDELLKILQ